MGENNFLVNVIFPFTASQHRVCGFHKIRGYGQTEIEREDLPNTVCLNSSLTFLHRYGKVEVHF